MIEVDAIEVPDLFIYSKYRIEGVSIKKKSSEANSSFLFAKPIVIGTIQRA